MPVISFAACVLSGLCRLMGGTSLWSVYDSKLNMQLNVSAQTEAWQCIVSVRKQPCGTYNPISRLAVVAYWPADSADQPRYNLQRAKLQSYNASPHSGHSTLGQWASLQSMLWQAVRTQHPRPNRASINLGQTFPWSWSCVHINCQLVATRGTQRVKGRAGHPDSVEETWPTKRAEEAQRPRPQSLHTETSMSQAPWMKKRPFQQ